MALVAIQSGLEQTRHSVCDDRLISRKIVKPGNSGTIFNVLPINIWGRFVGLSFHTVEVFMQSIDESCKIGVRIFLVIILKLRVDIPDDFFNLDWPVGLFFSTPHVLGKSCIGFCQFPGSPHGVVLIDLLPIGLTQEVLSKLLSMR